MRTACGFRRSWSQLCTVSRRSAGHAQIRGPRTAVTVAAVFGDRAFTSACWWSCRAASHQNKVLRHFRAGLSRSTGVSVAENGIKCAVRRNWRWSEVSSCLNGDRVVEKAADDEEDSDLDVRKAVRGRRRGEENRAVWWDENENAGAGGGVRVAELLAGGGGVGRADRALSLGRTIFAPLQCRTYSTSFGSSSKSKTSHTTGSAPRQLVDYSQRAVVTALWCNFLVFSLKLGVWIMTSSHVMLAETIHSLADLANQGLIAYGLVSSRKAPDAMHPYGYSKERFVWSLISAVGIFCLGSGATIIHGVQNLWHAQPLENTYLAALVIGGSMIMEGASLIVAINCVRNGAKEESMSVRDYLWGGHDPTTVAVMAEDSAAVAGLAVAGLALLAVQYTGNPVWDPIGSIIVGNLLGAVAIFLIQRNRHALLGRSMDEPDMIRVLQMLSKDPVVDAIYDCKSEMIGPGAYRFKAEIDFNGVRIVQNYIQRAGRGTWKKEFQEAASSLEPGHLDRVMAAYGEEVVSALGSEVDRLEGEIKKVVPGIRHVDIEAHNPYGPVPREKLYRLTSEALLMKS